MRIKSSSLVLCGWVCAFLLAACAGSTPPASTPTVEVAQPPTPAASTPGITLSPVSGGAGTRVTIIGVGFPADAQVSVHLGVPSAGAGLKSYVEGLTDAGGNVGLSFVLPAEWPDGRRITENKLVIQVVTDNLGAAASAEFDYATSAQPAQSPSPLPPTPIRITPAAPPADYPTEPAEVVTKFLTSLMNDPGGNSSLPYLSPSLQTEVGNGRTLLQILGISTLYRSFTPDTQGSSSAGSVTFQVTLNFESESQARIFILSQEDGVWRISAVAAAENANLGEPGQVTQDFMLSLLKDHSGNSSLKYLSRRLATEVQGGRSILSIMGIQDVFKSFTYEIVVMNSGGVSTIRVTMGFDSGPQVRTFTLIQESGGWRIDSITAQ